MIAVKRNRSKREMFVVGVLTAQPGSVEGVSRKKIGLPEDEPASNKSVTKGSEVVQSESREKGVVVNGEVDGDPRLRLCCWLTWLTSGHVILGL